jgi:hypothetical protein
MNGIIAVYRHTNAAEQVVIRRWEERGSGR